MPKPTLPWLLLLLVVGLASLASACGSDCSGRAAAGIEFHISRVDGADAPVPTAVRLKQSSADAFSDYQVGCEQGQPAEQVCIVWEVTGSYDYEVEVASQTFSGTVRVREDADGCHPNTERVNLAIP